MGGMGEGQGAQGEASLELSALSIPEAGQLEGKAASLPLTVCKER